MSDSAAQSDGSRAHKKPRTRVKVVASRYAQALQKKNQQIHLRHHEPIASTDAAIEHHKQSKTSTNASAASTSVEDHFRSRAASESNSTTSKAPQRSVSVSQQAVDNQPASPATPSDIRARLEAYRASKKQQKQPASSGSTVGNPRAARITKKADPSRVLRSKPRPAFPGRIATPIERTTKRTPKVASTPRQEETILSRPRSAGTGGSSSRSSSSGRQSATRDGRMSSIIAMSAKTAAAAPPSEAEELELLESLYYQLSLAEARAEASFRRQEQRAEKQILAAWTILQTKLQQLQDATLRLDRERHMKLQDTSIQSQAAPTAQVAERLPNLLEVTSVVSASLEAALDRLPTPGLVCDAPAELQRHLESLTAELDGLLERLRTTHLDTSMSCAVTFEQGMQQDMDKFNAALLQAAHLLGELQGEVDAETSMTIQKIQQQRLTF